MGGVGGGGEGGGGERCRLTEGPRQLAERSGGPLALCTGAPAAQRQLSGPAVRGMCGRRAHPRGGGLLLGPTGKISSRFSVFLPLNYVICIFVARV